MESDLAISYKNSKLKTLTTEFRTTFIINVFTNVSQLILWRIYYSKVFCCWSQLRDTPYFVANYVIYLCSWRHDEVLARNRFVQVITPGAWLKKVASFENYWTQRNCTLNKKKFKQFVYTTNLWKLLLFNIREYTYACPSNNIGIANKVSLYLFVLLSIINKTKCSNLGVESGRSKKCFKWSQIVNRRLGKKTIHVYLFILLYCLDVC